MPLSITIDYFNITIQYQKLAALGWMTKTPDVLDFFVCRGITDTYLSVEENYDSEGSHSPIIGTISTTVITKAKTPKLYDKKTDWHSYQV